MNTDARAAYQMRSVNFSTKMGFPFLIGDSQKTTAGIRARLSGRSKQTDTSWCGGLNCRCRNRGIIEMRATTTNLEAAATITVVSLVIHPIDNSTDGKETKKRSQAYFSRCKSPNCYGNINKPHPEGYRYGSLVMRPTGSIGGAFHGSIL